MSNHNPSILPVTSNPQMAEALCQERSEAEAKRTLDMEMPSRQFTGREDGEPGLVKCVRELTLLGNLTGSQAIIHES